MAHLSANDPKLALLIARIGKDALIRDIGRVKPPTQARLFDKCLRSITFAMVSVDGGNAFLRRLAIKIGVCLENTKTQRRKQVLQKFIKDMKESGENLFFETEEEVMDLLLAGAHNEFSFTADLVGELVKECDIHKGKRNGYPVSTNCFYFEKMRLGKPFSLIHTSSIYVECLSLAVRMTILRNL